MDEYTRKIIPKLPCFVIDEETNSPVYGIMTGIKKIDRIDYKLSYSYMITMFVKDDGSIENINEKFNFEKIQSYNHLESMQVKKDLKNISDVRRDVLARIFKGIQCG